MSEYELIIKKLAGKKYDIFVTKGDKIIYYYTVYKIDDYIMYEFLTSITKEKTVRFMLNQNELLNFFEKMYDVCYIIAMLSSYKENAMRYILELFKLYSKLKVENIEERTGTTLLLSYLSVYNKYSLPLIIFHESKLCLIVRVRDKIFGMIPIVTNVTQGYSFYINTKTFKYSGPAISLVIHWLDIFKHEYIYVNISHDELIKYLLLIKEYFLEIED